MPDTKPLRVWLELWLGDHVSGRVVDEAGGEHPFTGWLGFFSRLEQIDDDQPSPSRSRTRHSGQGEVV